MSKEKEFNLSEGIDELNECIPVPIVKEFIRRLKEDDNKIMCDLLRGKITIGEAQARLLQSRNKLAGKELR